MNVEAKTYEELIRQRNCYKITKYYNITIEQLDEIYEFLNNNVQGVVKCIGNEIRLIDGLGSYKVLNAQCISYYTTKIIVTNTSFKEEVYHIQRKIID